MSESAYFSKNYAEARGKFRDAVAAAGLRFTAHLNPAKGPEGEELTADVVWIGPPDASRLVIGLSGTHGAETFSGSAIQTAWLTAKRFARLPGDTAVILIHALNPYGFAWVRRVTEDNIDLNRNFVDHDRPYPDNPGYRQLRDSICPVAWTEDSTVERDPVLVAYAKAHGLPALQSAIMQGQYFDKDGVFYGGTGPAWSNRLLHQVLAAHAAHVRAAAFIDLHTGLGPYGYGEIISSHAFDAPGDRRVRDWYGAEATSIDNGSSSAAISYGDTSVGVERALPRTDVTGITLEYGTCPLEEMMTAVRADNWLYVHGDPASAKGRAIKAQIRNAFFQDRDDWKKMIIARADDVLGRAMKGLTQS